MKWRVRWTGIHLQNWIDSVENIDHAEWLCAKNGSTATSLLSYLSIKTEQLTKVTKST